MNVYELYAKLFLDTDEYEEKIDEAEGDAHKFGSTLGKTLKAGAKVATAAMGAAYTAVSALTKNAVGEYAQYEQLVGGVEKLFGTSAKTVERYASQAFQSAGMSANEYMETVTGFSASLISSLGGDTAKAARVANRAIKDMSDNANVFGSDMATVQSAYQAFAKQNYTLLDNLKLGYGGTQEEMQRLVFEASQMTEVMEELGVTVKGDSLAFDNIINAISVVQKKMDITGTTANEAAGTIEGSTNMMKAAWKNLLTGIAAGDQDLGKLTDNLLNSVSALGSNIVPRISTALEGFGSVIEGLAPMMADTLPTVVGQMFPILTRTAVSLVQSFGVAFVSSVPSVANYLFQTALNIINFLSSGVAQSIPVFLANALPMLLKFSESLRANAGTLVDAGIQLIINIAKGLIVSLPLLIEYIPQIVENIADIINENAPKLLFAAIELIRMLGQGLIDSIPAIKENIVNIINAIIAVWNAINWINLGKTVVNGIVKILKNFPNVAKGLIKNAVNAMKGAFTSGGLPNVVSTIFNAIKSKIGSAISAAVSVVKNGVGLLKKTFKFSWSLPKISVPHFTVSGGKAPWGFGGQGSLPSISVKWYKRAYDNAILFNDPTVLYDGMKARGFGDGNGGEMVVGEDYLMDKIKKAQGGGDGLTRVDVAKLIDLLEAILQAVMSGKKLYLDKRVLVGSTVNDYNNALGKLAFVEGR